MEYYCHWMRKLYCGNCKKHTEHEDLVNYYSTVCKACGCQTNQLMRLQLNGLLFKAPDGVMAEVVENTPNNVTFYIPSGEHKGYYHHNKHTGEKKVIQA